MTQTRLWRSRVIFLTLSVALWIAILPLQDHLIALRITIGLAILGNVLFLFVSFGVPTSDAFDLGENVGKSVGYQAGYRDGMQAGAALSNATGPRSGAELIGLKLSGIPDTVAGAETTAEAEPLVRR